jgi:hypothetical protein
VWVVPTVNEEIARDGSPEEQSWRDVAIGEIHDDSDTYHGCVTTKTYRYMDYHADPRECRVVVEAECAKLDAFLTLNEDLTKALADRVEQIDITSPSAYWASVNVPRGAEPRWTPGPGGARSWVLTGGIGESGCLPWLQLIPQRLKLAVRRFECSDL